MTSAWQICNVCVIFAFFILITKVVTNEKSSGTSTRVSNEVFLQHIYDVTDDVILQSNMSYQLSTRKRPYAMVFPSPRGN